MGLDMYLDRCKKGCSMETVSVIEDYLDWENEENEKKYSFKEWCGHDLEELPCKEIVEIYKKDYIDRYFEWDTEHKCPHKSIKEQVGYWRKANAIHNWFVENVQDGNDDCRYYEVSKSKLIELRDLCQKVLDTAIMKDGYVHAYYTYRDINEVIERERKRDGNVNVVQYDDGRIQVKVPGKLVANSDELAELLPTSQGFFFGTYEYDEYYLEDIRYTVDTINKVLIETDFDNYSIAYCASW